MKGHMMKNVENEGQEISSLRIYAVLCFVTRKVHRATFVLAILMLSYVALSGRSNDGLVRLRSRSRDMKIKGRKIARARSGGGENICRCSLVLTWQFPTVEYQSGGKGKTRADLRMFLFSGGLAISCV